MGKIRIGRKEERESSHKETEVNFSYHKVEPDRGKFKDQEEKYKFLCSP